MTTTQTADGIGSVDFIDALTTIFGFTFSDAESLARKLSTAGPLHYNGVTATFNGVEWTLTNRKPL